MPDGMAVAPPALSCPVPAAREFFGERLDTQYREHYHLIASVFNGVVLAGAAVSMLAILSAPEAAGPKLSSLALWMGSFGTLLCAYNGPMVNSILITRAPTRIDVVTPFILGVLGFALFVVLMPLRAPASGVAPSSDA